MLIASARPEFCPSPSERWQARKLSLCFAWLIVGFTAGCGGSTDKATGPATVGGGGLASEPPVPAVDASPASPPGKIEMPAGVDPASLPTAAASPGNPNKSGGFEMPKIESTPSTVISQRPVLDDAIPADSAPKTKDALSAKDPATIQLTAATWAKLESVIADADKICVVDIWSLSCEPCLKEFPGLVRLHRELGDKVTCISLNVDYDGRKTKPAETYRLRVEAFLQSSGADFGNYLCETANEELYANLKIASIPAVLVYDASGKLVRTFTDTGKDLGFGYNDDILPFVKSLVAE